MALIAAEVVPTAAGRVQHDQLVQGLQALGLRTGPSGSVSLSIAAEHATFERLFPDVDFGRHPAELPVTALPGRLQPLVEQILFTRGYGPFGE
jgi:hypothetical protein